MRSLFDSIAALDADDYAILAVLVALLAALFAAKKSAIGKRVYSVVPLLLFCYFVPTLLSNTGAIPQSGDFELYKFVKNWLLPSSLLLLVLALDIPAILRLGPRLLWLFVTAFSSVIVAGPIALLALGWLLAPESIDQAWRGLAALSGSWIGGGANMTAIQQSFGASDAILGAIVVVDVAIGEFWTAVLIWIAGREEKVDAKIGADRSAIESLKARVEAIAAERRDVASSRGLAHPPQVGTLAGRALIGVGIAALALGATWLCSEFGAWLHRELPENNIGNAFTWTVMSITLLGLLLSFTPLRRLEAWGASTLGSWFLFLLVTTIGAKAHFAKVFAPENLPLVAIGALWMILHVTAMYWVRRRLRAPIFFLATSSKACIGGAASCPIVAGAFHPSLAPVGALLAIFGYVVGTLGGIICANLLRVSAGVWS